MRGRFDLLACSVRFILPLTITIAVISSTTRGAQAAEPWQAGPASITDDSLFVVQPWEPQDSPWPSPCRPYECQPQPLWYSEPPLESPLVRNVESRKIGDPKSGVLQRVDFSGTWLAGGGISDFGISELTTSLTLGLPFPRRDTPLLITPLFTTRFLEGPPGPDMPPRVYDAELRFRTMRMLNERWGVDLDVSPGWHSDFETSSRKALRITGRGIVAYTWSPALQILLGAVYLDRTDINVLPVAGLIWTPHEDTRLELVFPKPRYARRFYADPYEQLWWYVAGEFGGGTWAVERVSGLVDEVNYRDYRVMLGLDRRVLVGLNGTVEIGYVFGRKLEYETSMPDYDPKSTLMLRTEVWW